MARKPRFPAGHGPALEQAKTKICHAIRRSMSRQQMTQTQLAARLGTSRCAVARVQAAKIETITFNQLFRYLSVLEPNFDLMVSF